MELKTIVVDKVHWVNVPLGTFYVFEIKKTALSQKIEAYDKLYQKKLEDKYISKLKYPTNTLKIIDELCSKLGIGRDNLSGIPELVVVRPEVVTDLKLNDDGKYEVVELTEEDAGYDQVGFG